MTTKRSLFALTVLTLVFIFSPLFAKQDSKEEPEYRGWLASETAVSPNGRFVAISLHHAGGHQPWHGGLVVLSLSNMNVVDVAKAYKNQFPKAKGYLPSNQFDSPLHWNPNGLLPLIWNFDFIDSHAPTIGKRMWFNPGNSTFTSSP